MDKSKILVKIAIIIQLYLIVGYIILFSMYAVGGTFVSGDVAFIELSWADLATKYPNLASLIVEYMREFGILGICIELYSLFTVYMVFWKDSKPAWFTLVILYAMMFIMVDIISFPIIILEQAWTIMVVYIINDVVFAISALISGKELLAKKD